MSNRVGVFLLGAMLALAFVPALASADVMNPDWFTKHCPPGVREVKCSFRNAAIFADRIPGECDRYSNNPDYYFLVGHGSTWGGEERYCERGLAATASPELQGLIVLAIAALSVFGLVRIRKSHALP